MKTSGFTLIGLLVVIAIIAILAALWLPASAGASSKRHRPCLTTLSNSKPAAAYTSDYQDRLPPNNSVYAIGTTPTELLRGASWCLGVTRTDTSTTNIEQGLLFPYNRSVAIYRCPADRSTVEDGSGKKLSQLRTRSYNMSQAVNGWPDFDWFNNSLMPSFQKFTQINRPGTDQLFVFLDVHEDEILDAHFGIPTAERFPGANNGGRSRLRHNQGPVSPCRRSCRTLALEIPKVFQRLAQAGPARRAARLRPGAGGGSPVLELDCQRGLEPAPQVLGVLEPDGNTDEVTGHAAGLGPIQFGVVGQQRERTGEGESGSEAGPLQPPDVVNGWGAGTGHRPAGR
jgi:hypothetical protein